MKLADWARKQGVHYMTAWKWYKAGKLPVKAYQTPSGSILVEENQPVNDFVACYCRVSSPSKKDDLKRQAQRCIDFCNSNGWAVDQVIKEVASGMNDKRPRLIKLLKKKPGKLVVEHKDRLTRFGFNYFEVLLPMLGVELVVMNRDEEEQDDLIKDLVAIITSFCCRLYGMRRGKTKAKEIVDEEIQNAGT